MKVSPALSVASLVVLWSAGALAQDPVKVAPDHYKVVLDNDTVRVLKVDYPAGSKAAMHSHPDAIAIPLTDSKGRFTTPDGKSEDRSMTAGEPLYTPADKHSPMNAGAAPMQVLLVEFKAPKPGTAALPTSRANMATKSTAEGPYATAYKATADPAFEEPAGSKHDYAQVVVALAPIQMSLSIDGKAPKTTWARGDVQYIGRNVPHASKNTSGKPVDFIIVAIK